MRQIPATSVESDAFSKDRKRRRLTFVGSTVVNAHMQAAGMINDHLVDCFRYPEIRQRSGSIGGLDPLQQHGRDVQKKAKRMFS